MPLSPQDRAYWRDRLGWKAFVYLFVSAVFMGCFVYPLLLFVLAWLNGHLGDWTFAGAVDMAKANFFLALLISLMMWLIAQLYYFMDWLPPRR
jgi:succinate dehydrogenase hydrophobic anchor subunit